MKRGGTGRVDLDSIRRDGSMVTYRAEFAWDGANGVVRRSINTAVIDCEKGTRKGLESEQFLADGSSRKGSMDMGWLAIRPDSVSAEVRRIICNKASAGE